MRIGVAPYTRQARCKDGMLSYGSDGIDYQHRPIGTGVVDSHLGLELQP